jgi:hypothetical protein
MSFTPVEPPELPPEPNDGDLIIAGNGSFGSLNSAGITTTATIEVTGTGISTDASTATISVDASTTQLYSHIASFSGNRTFQVSNLTDGRWTTLYIRNTNASSRTITIQASATSSGFANVNLSNRGSTSSVSFTASATSGTAVVWLSNIGGNIIGSLS